MLTAEQVANTVKPGDTLVVTESNYLRPGTEVEYLGPMGWTCGIAVRTKEGVVFYEPESGFRLPESDRERALRLAQIANERVGFGQFIPDLTSDGDGWMIRSQWRLPIDKFSRLLGLEDDRP